MGKVSQWAWKVQKEQASLHCILCLSFSHELTATINIYNLIGDYLNLRPTSLISRTTSEKKLQTSRLLRCCCMHQETSQTNLDDGNFLELLSHYDPVLKENKIKKKKKYSHLTHYLSPEMPQAPQKWLHLWPKSEKNNVLAESGEAIYFCDMQLNTRHVSHWSKHVIGKISRQRDQVWAINKRFVQIKDVANMSGKVMGVQAQKLKEYPLATSSPCASHTLWLMQLTYALRFQHCLVL